MISIARENINNAIDYISQYFYESPYCFLTEEDVRIHLAAKLLEKFSTKQGTAEEEISIPLHGEVRWYGNSKNLNIRSDIVLIETKALRVKHDRGFNLPSKGYGFSSALAVFEIKLRRPKYDSTDGKFVEKIQRDIAKLQTIRKMYEREPIPGGYWMLIVDHKGDIREQIASLQKDSLGVEIKYFCHADRLEHHRRFCSN